MTEPRTDPEPPGGPPPQSRWAALGAGVASGLLLAASFPPLDLGWLADRGHAVRGRIMGGLNDRSLDYWGPLLAWIEEAGLDPVIERTGFVDDPAAALAAIDVMLLTSRSEASPMCVLEAMSIGVPQVCFRVGGVDEMLGTEGRADGLADASGSGPAGMTVPEGDIAAMVTAVEQLLADPDLYHRQARAGQGRARALFSLETCVARHHTVYKAAVGTRSCSG